jgi:hypothetical protein
MTSTLTRVILVGTSHSFQVSEPQFQPFLEDLCGEYDVRAVAEELNADALEEKKCLASIAMSVAESLGLPHRFCDPSQSERSRLRIDQENDIRAQAFFSNWPEGEIDQRIAESHLIREKYWLEELQGLDEWPVVFVCGANHIASFTRLLQQAGIVAQVAVEDWSPADEETANEEYLASLRKGLEKSVRFFGADNKAERELWVVNEFLTNLGLTFIPSEMAHVTDDPPDVRFRGAEFEVKEILDERRRRHADFKAALAKANAATSPADLLEGYTPRDITYEEIYGRVETKVAELAGKYAPAVRAQLDLLFYVNLEDVHGYIETPLPSSERLSNYGFRSISFVMGSISGVFMAGASAPEVLVNGGIRVVRHER